MAKFFRAAIFIASILSASSVFAACHVVTPSGSGGKTGADWNNAYAGLPGTLVRGDVYYLADGSYPAFTFNQSNSGTSTVEVRKAQSYDNCTATGWNTSTMGASQAVFSSNGAALTTNSSYLILNGNGTSKAQGCGGAPGATVTSEPSIPSDCGIRLVGAGGTTSGSLNIVSLSNGSNVTLEYVELVGSGTNNIGGNGDLEIFGGGGNLTIKHMYARNSGCVYIQDVGNNSVVDHSYFWGTEVYGAPGSACHGQAEFEAGGTSNGVRSNNMYRDILGTAVWTFAAGSGTNNNWQFYNNIVWYSSPLAGWVQSAGAMALANGILACINSGVYCTNFTVVQNTIANCGNFGGLCAVLAENPGSFTVENNLWYKDSAGVGFSGSSITRDHNSYLASTTGCPTGTAEICDNSAPSPFTNWMAGDFTLASDATDWVSRASLAPPFGTDAAGNAFTTDRGAYQHSGTVAQGPQPPTGLQVAVQ
jgi:hypothetical protein